MQTDYWCGNCQQMVRAKRSQKIIGFVAALLCWLVVIPAMLPAFGVPDWGSQWWFQAAGWLFIGVSALAALPVTRSCPICKSTNLVKQRPA